MKNILILSSLLAGAVGAYAQGTVTFADPVSGQVVAHIYSPDTASPSTEFQGNISQAYNFSHQYGDYPAGTTVYTGSLIGASTATGIYSGTGNFDVQLWAVAGNSLAPETSLAAVSQYTSTSVGTGNSAGFFVTPTINNDPGIPGTGTGTAETSASIELRAWYNDGGTITTWAEALTGNGNTANAIYGKSTEFLLGGLGGTVVGANPPDSAPNLVGLTSFSLVTAVPEPSEIALLVMGASAFILRRRK